MKFQLIESITRESVTIILPTFNESGSIEDLILSLSFLNEKYNIDILVVDDDSPDGTASIVKKIANQFGYVRLIQRIGRSGLASAIKEGLINSRGEIALVMDGDGQHDVNSIVLMLDQISDPRNDLVLGSRFQENSNLIGLSSKRELSSNIANAISRLSLHSSYSQLTDYMSGCFALRLRNSQHIIRKVDVNGFKFLYELLAISKGILRVKEVPIIFNKRMNGSSKIDIAILWDFLVSILHSMLFRIPPRRSISFALVGLSGVFVQLFVTNILINFFILDFQEALPLSVLSAATSNYLINNTLTFRTQRLNGIHLFKGLLKFLLVATLPILANVGLASAFYNYIYDSTIYAQLAGIFLVFLWNYVASSTFVWNSPR